MTCTQWVYILGFLYTGLKERHTKNSKKHGCFMQNHSDSLKGENVCKEIAGHFGGKVLRGLIIVWGFFSWRPGEGSW